jgi:hypothetical protein
VKYPGWNTSGLESYLRNTLTLVGSGLAMLPIRVPRMCCIVVLFKPKPVLSRSTLCILRSRVLSSLSMSTATPGDPGQHYGLHCKTEGTQGLYCKTEGTQGLYCKTLGTQGCVLQDTRYTRAVLQDTRYTRMCIACHGHWSLVTGHFTQHRAAAHPLYFSSCLLIALFPFCLLASIENGVAVQDWHGSQW